MRRRTFICASASLLLPLAASAQQQSKLWRIGFFYFGSRQSAVETGRYAAFLQGMREAGYTEGKNFVIEARYADGNVERLPALAAELIRSNLDVIVSTHSTLHRVLQKATSTIPIVITLSPDPVKEGLAANLARPGGNITGLSSSNLEISGKYLEILSDTVRLRSGIGVLYHASNTSHPAQLENVRAAVGKAGIQLHLAAVRTPQDIDAAFQSMARNRPDAAIVLGEGLFVQYAHQLTELALKYRLPVLYSGSELPAAGGLMSYGVDIKDNHRRAAAYVVRILKGAKPADLPIEQPNKIELVINLKTAKAIGIEIPKPMLFRADRLIE